MAMARPRLPDVERELVIAAAAGTAGSARAMAARLARQVAREAVAFVDREPGDLADALVRAEAALAPTPVFLLATLPEIDTAALVMVARTRRYAARGCRQLAAEAWRAEGEAVTEEVGEALAERYRRHLATQKVGVNRVFPQTHRLAS
jgi:hypothetical protein